MIDTDKYEGHTGPWFLIDGDIYKGGPKETWRRDNMIADTAFGGYGSNKARYADRWLMADAPLILQALIDEQAEVKRLREGISKVADNMAKLIEAYSSHLADEEVADWIDGFTKDMLELVE